MNNISGERLFNRHLLDFAITVKERGNKGESEIESTAICDISGGGLRFKSRQAEKYSPGQKLEISIILPKSGNDHACMISCGQVVRIIGSNQPQNSESEVAIKLLTPFRFERTV
jgi:c-di-GMP-binding flagellar brake protein YcgR